MYDLIVELNNRRVTHHKMGKYPKSVVIGVRVKATKRLKTQVDKGNLEAIQKTLGSAKPITKGL